MKYQILLAPSAKKEFGKLPADAMRKIEEVIDMISQAPYAGKKLGGEYAGLWAVRAWPYRIMYEIVETRVVVYVVRIRHRKDAYREFANSATVFAELKKKRSRESGT